MTPLSTEAPVHSASSKSSLCNTSDSASLEAAKDTDEPKPRSPSKNAAAVARCAFCSYETRRISNLNRHIKTHTGVRCFDCPHCEYKAARRDNLEKHLLIHTGRVLFECKYCSYTTIASNSFYLHLRTHSEEQPFRCEHDGCGYKTAHKIMLTTHLRTHSNETPYHCTSCSYKSSQSGDLKKHMRKHSGKSPYHCPHCDFQAKYSSNFQLHIISHAAAIVAAAQESVSSSVVEAETKINPFTVQVEQEFPKAVVKRSKAAKNDPTFCDNCLPDTCTSATSYCAQCESKFCETCLLSVHSFRTFSSHVFTTIGTLREKTKASALLSSSTSSTSHQPAMSTLASSFSSAASALDTI
jgi:hypothetical protein